MSQSNKLLMGALVCVGVAMSQAAFAATLPYRTQILSQSPVVYFQMDESSGTTATDSSGNSHNGTYGVVYDATKTASPAPTITLGSSSASSALNTALAVSGGHGNGYDPVQLTDVAALNAIGAGPFSIQYWFQTSDVANREDLFDFRGPVNDLSMQVNNGVAGGLTVFNNGGTALITSSAGVISANTWYMVTLTRDASNNLDLYLNGSLLNTGTNAQSLDTGVSGVLAIGNKDSGSAHLLDGSLDEFAFYNSALTASNVATDYALGAPVPEPASLGLLTLGGIALLARRRRHIV